MRRWWVIPLHSSIRLWSALAASRLWSVLAASLAAWGAVLATTSARWESAANARIGGWLSVLGAIVTRWWSRLTATRGWARLTAFTAHWWAVLGRPAVRWWSGVTATRPFVRRWVPMALAALIVVGPVVGTLGSGGDSTPTAANMSTLAEQQRSPQPADSAGRAAGDRASRGEARSEAPRKAGGPAAAASPSAAASTPDKAAAPATTKPAEPTPVAGLSQVQMDHAKTIVDVGEQMGLPRQAYIVAISTALQESQLLNMANWGSSDSLNRPHDGVGSDWDSVGLFQQRPSSGWGTVAELMDPATSARRFYQALERVPGWENMPVTVAAQTVQGSAFPDAYAKHVSRATQIVDALLS